LAAAFLGAGLATGLVAFLATGLAVGFLATGLAAVFLGAGFLATGFALTFFGIALEITFLALDAGIMLVLTHFNRLRSYKTANLLNFIRNSETLYYSR
jgi:hypothetical protein